MGATGHGWKSDDFDLICSVYAHDILLFSRSTESLDVMFDDCGDAFTQTGLELGLDDTHWSRAALLLGDSLQVRGTSAIWERTLEFIGSEKRRCCQTPQEQSLCCFHKVDRYALAEWMLNPVEAL